MRPSILVCLAVLPFLACKTNASDKGADAGATDAAPAAPSVASSVASAPARWKSLVPKTTLADSPPNATRLRFFGDTLVAWSEGASAASAYAKGATTPMAKLDAKDVVLAAEPAGELLLGAGDKKLSAFDARSLAPKWSVEAGATAIVSCAATPAAIVVVVSKDGPTELLGLEPASGAVKWRAPGAGTSRVFGAGERVIFGADGVIGALDPATGKELWRKDVPGSRPVAADAVRAVAAWQTTRVFDAATGADQGVVSPIVRQYLTARIDDKNMFGLTLGATETRLFAVDLAARKEVWNRSHPHEPGGAPRVRGAARPPLDHREDLLVDDDAVIVASRDGLLHAYERSDGKERWVWPVFGGGGMAVRHAPAFALYVGGPHGVLVLEEGHASSEHATIKGTLTLDGKPLRSTRLWVRERPVDTDAKGAFTTELDAIGAVPILVDALGAKGCPLEAEHVVELAGKGTYEVAVQAIDKCQPAPKK